MLRITVLSIFLSFYGILLAQEPGSSSWVYDETLFDSQYPVSKQFVKAGIEGGIPELETSRLVNTDENLQAAINAASSGDVLELMPGEYEITTPLQMRNNVVLRGSNDGRSVFKVKLRALQKQKKYAVRFEGVQHAGLERIHFEFDAPAGVEPIDRETVTDGGWCGDCFSNNPDGHDDLHVGYIYLDPDSENCWVKQCRLIAAGTDPIFCRGNHITFMQNYVDRSYNKGSNGAGYYNIYGDYNLVVRDTVRRIRHFAIQHGAQYNVVYQSHFEVDINFHNGDGGSNLVEDCTMRVANWHGWDIFIGGVKGTHQPPGPDNMFFNNEAVYRWYGHRYDHPDTIYSFEGYKVVARADWPKPIHGTLYPMKNLTTGIASPAVERDLIYPNPAQNQLFISVKEMEMNASVNIAVFGLDGQQYKALNGHNNAYFDISELNSGTYILHIVSGKKKKNMRFVKL